MSGEPQVVSRCHGADFLFLFLCEHPPPHQWNAQAQNMCGLIAKLCLLMRAVSPVTITDVSMASSIPIDTDCQERLCCNPLAPIWQWLRRNLLPLKANNNTDRCRTFPRHERTPDMHLHAPCGMRLLSPLLQRDFLKFAKRVRPVGEGRWRHTSYMWNFAGGPWKSRGEI